MFASTRTTRSIRALVAATALALATPAAAAPPVKEAERHAEAGRWEDAVESIEIAVGRRPNNETLQDLLAQYEEEAATDRADRALECLERGKYREADRHASRAMSFDSAAPGVRDARTEVAEANTWLDRQIADARAAIDTGKPLEAIRIVQAAQDKAVDESRLDQLLSEGTEAARQAALGAGEAALERYEFEAARANLDEAARYGSVEGSKLARRLREVARIQEAIRNAPTGDPIESYRSLADKLKRHPGFPELGGAFDAARGRMLFGVDTSDEDSILEAVDTLRHGETLGHEDDLETTLRPLRAALADIYELRALEAMTQDSMGHMEMPAVALVYLRKAMSADPTRRATLSRDIPRVDQELSRRTRRNVAVHFEDYTGAAESLRVQAEGRSRSAIGRAGFPGVRPVADDQETVVGALDKQALELGYGTGEYWLDVHVAQLAIVGSITDDTVETTGEYTPQYKTSRKRTGTHQEQNPQYGHWQAQVQNQEARVRSAEANYASSERNAANACAGGSDTSWGDVAACGAANTAKVISAGSLGAARRDLGTARSRLGSTPRMITVQDYEDYSYEVYDLERRAAVRGEVHIRDNTTLIERSTIELSARADDTDRWITGVDPADDRGVKSDPKQLQSEDQVRRSAHATFLEKLEKKVAAEVEQLMRAEVVRSHELRDAGRDLEALELQLELALITKGSPLGAELAQAIRDEIGFDIVDKTDASTLAELSR